MWVLVCLWQGITLYLTGTQNLVFFYFGLIGAGVLVVYHLLGLFLNSQFFPIDLCIYLNTTPLS